ncbi:MAG: hypothetical protein CM15mP106_3560 [Candidatus Neomarinimicrobiota bacterium]|nr:MAG: hypothetical protein CM15mP106_3560 [Candidatus Neomarinimicrobiota bacterium]
MAGIIKCLIRVLNLFKELKFTDVQITEPGKTKIGYKTSIDLNERKTRVCILSL